MDRNAPARLELERFIHERYAQVHGADVRHYLPYLLTLRHPLDGTLGVLGYRPACDGQLFLESYLDSPVEEMLSRRLGAVVPRSAIVEVGNLACATPGGARALIMLMTAYVKAAGIRWVIFTALPALRNSFTRLGITLLPLRHADKERIADAERQWGRYYEGRPTVIAGNVHAGFHVLRHALFCRPGSFQTKALWCRAYRMGSAARATLQSSAAPPLHGLGT